MFTSLKRTINTRYFQIIGLFFLSFITRFFYCFNRLTITPDSKAYVDLAKNLYLHKSFAFSDGDGNLILTAFRPLLYPLFIALIDGDKINYGKILFVQCILGAITVVFVYLIASDAFGRFVGLLSGLMLTFAPLTVHYTSAILSETLFTFLVISAIYLWSRERFYFSGTVFGLASLCKPIIFPFLIFLLVFLVFPEMRKQWKSYLIITVFAFLVASPWMFRNSILLNSITLTQSSGFGTNLLVGTIDTPMWGNTNRVYSSPILQNNKKLGEIERDRERFKTALNRIVSNPFFGLRLDSNNIRDYFSIAAIIFLEIIILRQIGLSRMVISL